MGAKLPFFYKVCICTGALKRLISSNLFAFHFKKTVSGNNVSTLFGTALPDTMINPGIQEFWSQFLFGWWKSTESIRSILNCAVFRSEKDRRVFRIRQLFSYHFGQKKRFFFLEWKVWCFSFSSLIRFSEKPPAKPLLCALVGAVEPTGSLPKHFR